MASTWNLSTTTAKILETSPTPTGSPDVSKTLTNADVALIVVYVNIFLFGLVGNCLVIRYFGFKRKKVFLYHLYLIHLAVADLISSTITPIHFIYGVVAFNTWHLGAISCKAISIIGPLTVNVSAWLLTSIAHERYRGIVNPFKPRWTKLRIHLTVAAIWIVSVITLIPYMNALQLDEGVYCVPLWKKPVYELLSAILTLLLQSMLPIAFMVFTVSNILLVLKNRKKLLGKTTNKKKAGIDNSLLSSENRSFSVSSTSSYHGNLNTQRGSTSIQSPTYRYLSMSSFSVLLPQSNSRKHFSRLREESTPSPIMRNHSTNHNDFNRKKKSSRFLSNHRENALKISESPLESSFDESPFKKRLSQVSFNLPIRKHVHSSQSNTEDSMLSQNKTSLSLDTGLNKIASRKKEKCIMAGFRKKASVPVNRRKSIYQTMKKFMTIENKRAKKRGKKQRERIFMLIVTFSVFVICSLPYNVFYVASIIMIEFYQQYSKLEVLSNLNFWLSTLVVANSITNCAIYAGMDKGFRSYCFNLLNRSKWKTVLFGSPKKTNFERKIFSRSKNCSINDI